jgi:hypothetical protein
LLVRSHPEVGIMIVAPLSQEIGHRTGVTGG